MAKNIVKTPYLVIVPGGQTFLSTLKETWVYREVLYFLVWRDVSVKYKQTMFGVLWMVFQPLVATLLFTMIFSRVARVPSDGIPYPLFVLAGLIPWTFFSSALQRAGDSLVGNSNLVKKIYFPRIVIPISAALSGIVDFGVSLLTIGGIMIYFSVAPGMEIIALPFLTAMSLLLAIGAGLLFGALNVRFRDAKHILGYLVTMWMYATPVIYPYSMISDKYKALAMLNPMVGIVEGFKWSLLQRPFPGTELMVTVLITAVLLVVGQAYFRSVERTFADVI